jgi:MscS family membrane protein
MQHLINLINQNLSDKLIKLAAYLYTTPGHIALFGVLILTIVLLSWLFRKPLRKFVKFRLYKKRKELLYRLLFHRIEKIIKPFRYLVSIILLNVSVSIFGAGSGVDLFFFVLYTGMFAWWVYEIFKFMLYLSLSLRIEKQQSVRRELFNLILNILKIVIAFVVVLIILSKIGVNITGLITSLGIGGIVIGLSAKDTLTNFFDSIRLVGENAFNLGDWIQTEDVQGFVTEIGLAATRIRTFDNALVTIPNSKLASGYIKNWSKRIIGRRIKFQLKLKYTYDTAEIDRVLFEIREMVEQHPDIVNDNKLKYLIKMKQTYDNGLFNTKDTLGVRSTLMVYLDHIDSYSMNILIYALSISVNWEEWLGVKQDVIKKIIAIIDESELELALPAQDILVESSIDESPIAYQNVDSF